MAAWAYGVGLLGLLGAVAAVARLRLAVVTVVGDSMAPTYLNGDRVLMVRGRLALRRGRAVVFPTPAQATPGADGVARFAPGSELVVKRAVAVAGDPMPEAMWPVVTHRTVPYGHVVVFGDAARSVDSRWFGLVPVRRVRGVVIAQLHRAAPPSAPPPRGASSSRGTSSSKGAPSSRGAA